MATYGANNIVYPPEFFYFISRSDHYYFALYIHPCGIPYTYMCAYAYVYVLQLRQIYPIAILLCMYRMLN